MRFNVAVPLTMPDVPVRFTAALALRLNVAPFTVTFDDVDPMESVLLRLRSLNNVIVDAAPSNVTVFQVIPATSRVVLAEQTKAKAPGVTVPAMYLSVPVLYRKCVVSVSVPVVLIVNGFRVTAIAVPAVDKFPAPTNMNSEFPVTIPAAV